MFRRLYYSLFKPTRIALFIQSKIILQILYVIVLFLCSLTPSIIKYHNYNIDYSYEEVSNIVYGFDKEANAKFDNYKFINDKSFYVDYGSFRYSFGSQQELSKGYTIEFNETYLTIYNGSKALVSESYYNLKLENVDFSKISYLNKDFVSLKNNLSIIRNNFFKENIITFSSSLILVDGIGLVVLFFILFSFTSMLHPFLKRNHKFNIVSLSLTWYFVLTFISNMFDIEALGLVVGPLLSAFCVYKALSVIKVIKVPKEK